MVRANCGTNDVLTNNFEGRLNSANVASRLRNRAVCGRTDIKKNVRKQEKCGISEKYRGSAFLATDVDDNEPRIRKKRYALRAIVLVGNAFWRQKAWTVCDYGAVDAGPGKQMARLINQRAECVAKNNMPSEVSATTLVNRETVERPARELRKANVHAVGVCSKRYAINSRALISHSLSGGT